MEITNSLPLKVGGLMMEKSSFIVKELINSDKTNHIK